MIPIFVHPQVHPAQDKVKHYEDQRDEKFFSTSPIGIRLQLFQHFYLSSNPKFTCVIKTSVQKRFLRFSSVVTNAHFRQRLTATITRSVTTRVRNRVPFSSTLFFIANKHVGDRATEMLVSNTVNNAVPEGVGEKEATRDIFECYVSVGCWWRIGFGMAMGADESVDKKQHSIRK